MGGQIWETRIRPSTLLGCSGSLNSTVTVHLVNVGTSYLGRKTGLAAVDVRYGGREDRSSRSRGKPDTWRRILASRKF
ncbi:MAG: hypothetical protein ACXACD_18655 [Candidatus Thorarchaeota archaeon]|jgi:hypothetical protein